MGVVGNAIAGFGKPRVELAGGEWRAFEIDLTDVRADDATLARLPAAWSHYWLWQFTGDGIGPQPHTIPGITTQGIDINQYNGDPDNLAEEWA